MQKKQRKHKKLLSDVVAVFADGGVIGRNPSPFGGTWAYCWVNAQGARVRESSGIIKAELHHGSVTNNVSEYVALAWALKELPAGWSGKVCSDSMVTLGRFFWGWANKGIPDKWVTKSGLLVTRLGKLEPVLLQGHPTRDDIVRGFGAKRGFPVSEHNVWCDEECGRRAAEFTRAMAW